MYLAGNIEYILSHLVSGSMATVYDLQPVFSLHSTAVTSPAPHTEYTTGSAALPLQDVTTTASGK